MAQVTTGERNGEYLESDPVGTAIVAGRCRSCGAAHWLPRAHCPSCMSHAVEMVDLGPRGTVYSFAVDRRPSGAFAEREHLVIAYIQIDDGPVVLAHLVGCAPDEVRIGMSVAVVAPDDDAPSIRFRPEPMITESRIDA